jgi:hypothetical protein
MGVEEIGKADGEGGTSREDDEMDDGENCQSQGRPYIEGLRITTVPHTQSRSAGDGRRRLGMIFRPRDELLDWSSRQATCPSYGE